jgi:hypothetical protein
MALLLTTTVYGSLTATPTLGYGNGIITSGNVWSGNVVTVNGVFYANGVNILSPISSPNQLLQGSSNVFVSSASNTINVAISGSNVASFSSSGLSVTANVVVGNLVTSSIGNVYAGNVVTTNNEYVGNLITTGNVYAGYVITTSNTYTTGNTYTGNLVTLSTGNIYTSGNVYAGNLVISNNVYNSGNMITSGNIYAGNLVANSYTYIAGNVSAGTYPVGYVTVPQTLTSGTYTLTTADVGKHVYITATGGTITIPANATLPFAIGTTIAIVAGPSATTTTITIASDTLYLGGYGSTGNRTLSAYGMATLLKVAATTWFISGTGVN